MKSKAEASKEYRHALEPVSGMDDYIIDRSFRAGWDASIRSLTEILRTDVELVKSQGQPTTDGRVLLPPRLADKCALMLSLAGEIEKRLLESSP